jgi:hypothetical protein
MATLSSSLFFDLNIFSQVGFTVVIHLPLSLDHDYSNSIHPEHVQPFKHCSPNGTVYGYNYNCLVTRFVSIPRC